MQYFVNFKDVLVAATPVDIKNKMYECRIEKQLDYQSVGRMALIVYSDTNVRL